MEEKYLVCEDSLEGIFTGIYEAYVLKEDHGNIHIQIGEEGNIRLFASYIDVTADAGRAAKVARTINRVLGEEVYLTICMALSSKDSDKGEAVYKTIVHGLQMKNGRQVMDHLANNYIHKVFELSRGANNEAHHLQGFLRFQELENGILFSKIAPKNNIVTFLAPHFADRLPQLDFVIYDEKRGIFIVHPASKQWYIVTETDFNEEWMLPYSAEEIGYQELFKHFCHKIAIDGRKNLKLQRNMLPLRFQEYMVEFGK